MKRYIFIIILFFAINSSFAQFFELSFEDTMGQISPQNHSLLLAGHLINISNDTLHVKMVRLKNNLPSQFWSSSICLGLCFGPGVDSVSTRDLNMPIPPGDSILTEVIFFQGDTIPGTAQAQIKYATLNDSQVEIVWFEGHTLLNNIGNQPNSIDEEFMLFSNYPNPFNPNTNIKFKINKKSLVSLDIFNLSGQKIRSLLQNTYFSNGEFIFKWDATNGLNQPVSSGIYIYQLKIINNNLVKIFTKKMLLVR